MQNDHRILSVVELTDTENRSFLFCVCLLPFFLQQVSQHPVIVASVLARDKQVWV